MGAAKFLAMAILIGFVVFFSPYWRMLGSYNGPDQYLYLTFCFP
jgi:hypothetical protein